jgi:deazaflavin-dependent oxidoreductase (nitroreductase family)
MLRGSGHPIGDRDLTRSHGWRHNSSLMARYEKPDWLTKHVFNPLVSLLTNLGVSVRGSRILVVRGRKSGQIRTTPVNPLEIGGKRYLVAPRGETEWVRNLRAARGGELRLGRHREPIGVEELPDDLKPPILREYLRRWRMETGKFFDGVTAESPESELRRIAPRHPVFRVLSL